MAMLHQGDAVHADLPHSTVTALHPPLSNAASTKPKNC